jgi:hypothetical protein
MTCSQLEREVERACVSVGSLVIRSQNHTMRAELKLTYALATSSFLAWCPCVDTGLDSGYL